MNGKLNILQVFVPLTFLAIWALTSLFNREAQPLPPRAGRPPGPPGPRPGGGIPGSRPLDRRSEALAREAAARWSSASNNARPPAGRPAMRPDDEIVIIEDSRRPAPARPEPPAAARRGARPRANAAPPAKRTENPNARSLAISMGQDATSQLNRPLEFSALTKMVAPLGTPVTQEVAAAAHQAPKSASLACLTSGEIRSLMNSPAKLREAIVISEILRPPLALRRDRRGDF